MLYIKKYNKNALSHSKDGWIWVGSLPPVFPNSGPLKKIRGFAPLRQLARLRHIPDMEAGPHTGSRLLSVATECVAFGRDFGSSRPWDAALTACVPQWRRADGRTPTESVILFRRPLVLFISVASSTSLPGPGVTSTNTGTIYYSQKRQRRLFTRGYVAGFVSSNRVSSAIVPPPLLCRHYHLIDVWNWSGGIRISLFVFYAVQGSSALTSTMNWPLEAQYCFIISIRRWSLRMACYSLWAYCRCYQDATDDVLLQQQTPVLQTRDSIRLSCPIVLAD